ncbi:DUF4388 domain-containing protein [Acanthopleuribacter pedis]|uniref:DUF4388 domain-containing protein n=1 Tax=Acanthopleuribacter pedis TaxID=442870 RepID=A0A8J7QFL6_9BACT|nr:DUF4388 domain-containing protein [Acanthopleuribacter pedis]MBO1317560.1 DUF4388 domain-containing protein [Acanthopleuribacter pedis]
MSTQVLRGKIEPLALIEVFAYLGRHQETGILNVTCDEIKKSVIVHRGFIIFARSNQTQDRLGDVLLAGGMINQQQYDEATHLIYEKGYRHGRALVEIGAISPKLLWEAIQNQIHTIVRSLVPLEHGSFEFIRQQIKHKESITLQLSISEMVIDLIRGYPQREEFAAYFKNRDLCYQANEAERDGLSALEPYEQYIFNFLDGETPLQQLCALSDIGEEESLRVVYLLHCLGLIEPVALEEVPPLEVVPEPEPVVEPAAPPPPGHNIHPVIVRYCDIYRYIQQYLSERVGAMGTQLLRKYFEETARNYPAVYEGIDLSADGAPQPFALQERLSEMEGAEAQRVLAMEEALDEYLFAGILAVKKMLGAEHEGEVLRHIEQLA